jgi:hypothetical protein
VFEGSVNGVVCAIKEIELKTAEDERYMVREVELLMELRHPHVVRAFGESEGPCPPMHRLWKLTSGLSAAQAMTLRAATRGVWTCSWNWPAEV